MTKQEIKDGAPGEATHYLIYDGCLYYFQKRGAHMHQWIKTRFNPIAFSCSAFYKFKPLLEWFLNLTLAINLIRFTIGNIGREI